jgi:hypothetical protein
VTFQLGAGNVSLSVCVVAERVPCGFRAKLTTSDGGGISFRQRRRWRHGNGSGSGGGGIELGSVTQRR